MTMRKTKIICTLGPSTDDPAVLRELMLSGMDVARINMSHQDHDAHRARIDRVRALREELRLPIAILIDTKGPEIRLGTFPEKVTLKAGDTFTLTTVPAEGTAERASISFAGLPGDVDKGSHILIDDGLIDSLDIVAVVTELMEAFDVELGVDDLTPENFNSVEAIEELIESKQS